APRAAFFTDPLEIIDLRLLRAFFSSWPGEDPAIHVVAAGIALADVSCPGNPAFPAMSVPCIPTWMAGTAPGHDAIEPANAHAGPPHCVVPAHCVVNAGIVSDLAQLVSGCSGAARNDATTSCRHLCAGASGGIR